MFFQTYRPFVYKPKALYLIYKKTANTHIGEVSTRACFAVFPSRSQKLNCQNCCQLMFCADTQVTQF